MSHRVVLFCCILGVCFHAAGTVAVARAITVSVLGDCSCDSPYEFGAWHPAWSPDGESIASASGNAYPPLYLYWGSVVVWAVNGGSASCSYGDHTAVEYPSWAPDSRRLVFTDYASLRVLDCNSADQPEARWDGPARHPAWSPDGSTIAFESSGNIWFVSASGGIASQLTTTTGYSPAWSPDGTRIAYHAGNSIWIISAAGGEPRRLVEGNDPSWSPDGHWIAFASDREGGSDIWVIAATGGTAVRVTTAPEDESDPTWAPDQRSLAYSAASLDGACSCTFIASDLPADLTTSVTPASWGRVKSLYK